MEDWKRCEGRAVDGKLFIGQYLGGSDHSAVFLTEISEPARQKAVIKLIVADPERAQRQLARWNAAAKLSHPHLLRIFQAGRSQLADTDLLYVVMEQAEEDLSQILPQRALTPGEAQQMLPPVLDVLAYLHGNGFVHGHLRPSNIMAAGDQLKISSDTLYRIGESIRRLAMPSAYDPPEVSGGAISPAGNVWSLGMTLVEVLTQRLPVLEGAEDPVLPETLPPPFLEVVRHCLHVDPYQRWTIADIKARLEQATPASQSSAPASKPAVPAAPEPVGATAPRRAPLKKRYLAPVAVGLVLLAIVSGAKLLKRRPQLPPTPPSVPVQPAPAPPVRQLEPSTEPSASAPVQGAVVHQVVPEVPRSARDTIQGAVKVTVRVAVDPSGNVERATLDSAGPSRYFAGMALEAARGWKFRPPTIDGRDVPSEWLLRFEFEQTGTRVVPAPKTPNQHP